MDVGSSRSGAVSCLANDAEAVPSSKPPSFSHNYIPMSAGASTGASYSHPYLPLSSGAVWANSGGICLDPGVSAPPLNATGEELIDGLWSGAVQGPNIDPLNEAEEKIDFPPPIDFDDDLVRVRHYSTDIMGIKRDKMIVPSEMQRFFVFVEYPVTEYSEERVSSVEWEFQIRRPLNGFVEFNVDRKKWNMIPDPNLGSMAKNAWMIELHTSPAFGHKYVLDGSNGFPLYLPESQPLYFDRQGNQIH